MELQLWREMLTPYELAVDELVLKFRHIIREYRNVGRYSPIEQVDGRVKSISSILDKMQRKKINVNDVEKELEDIAGIRLICQFVEDIDRVLEIIESRSDMEIKSHKDYISHSKDSGYRSYHVIIYYEVNRLQACRGRGYEGRIFYDKVMLFDAVRKLWHNSMAT